VVANKAPEMVLQLRAPCLLSRKKRKAKPAGLPSSKTPKRALVRERAPPRQQPQPPSGLLQRLPRTLEPQESRRSEKQNGVTFLSFSWVVKINAALADEVADNPRGFLFCWKVWKGIKFNKEALWTHKLLEHRTWLMVLQQAFDRGCYTIR
jgi:hypothetical protein